MIRLIGKPVHGGPRVELETNSHFITYLIDTGAAVNVLDQVTLETVQVNGAVIFSTIDIMKAFHQLELDDSSRYMTTITTHIGLFRYRRLHMGINCASEIFSEEIRKLLDELPNQLNMTDHILI